MHHICCYLILVLLYYRWNYNRVSHKREKWKQNKTSIYHNDPLKVFFYLWFIWCFETMHFKRFEFIIRLLLLNLVLTFIVEYYTDGWLEKIPKILKHGMSLTDYKRIQFHHIVFDYFGFDIYLTYCVEIYIYIYLFIKIMYNGIYFYSFLSSWYFIQIC